MIPIGRVRKTALHREEIFHEGGPDADPPLLKVAAALVIANPYAGRYAETLDELIEPSAEWGRQLVGLCGEGLSGAGLGFGKAAIVGAAGEQEHGVACMTTPFGDALREGVGGNTWVPSNTKVAGVGASIDIPLAYSRALFVREFYDTVSLTIADAPRADEIVVAIGLATRGRVHHRVGGLTVEAATAGDGLR